MSLQEDNGEVEDEIVQISKDVCKIVIDNGPYICANCLEVKNDWDDMESALYTRITCESCN